MEKAMSTFELDHYTGFEKFEKIIPPRRCRSGLGADATVSC